MAKKTEEKEETGVVPFISAELPDYLRDMSSNRGSENVTKDDLIIPRLNLLQDLSPEIKERDPLYIPGAKAGLFSNTVTKEVYGDAVIVIPVFFEKVYLAWKDRKKGGGLGGQFKTSEEAEEAIETFENPEDWKAEDTPTHICLLVSADGKTSEIAVSMPRSKAKISRQWNSMVRLFEGDRFSRAYKITAIPAKNSVNQDFWNFKIDPAGFPTEDIYRKAEKLYTDISTGAVKYTVDQEETVSDADSDASGPNKPAF